MIVFYLFILILNWKMSPELSAIIKIQNVKTDHLNIKQNLIMIKLLFQVFNFCFQHKED